MKVDIAIIGAGPAGLTAGIYAMRAGLSAQLFDMGFPGGQAATTNIIENFPGFPDGIGGPELGQMMLAQAEHFGLNLRYEEVTSLELAGDEKKLHLSGGETLSASAVILCMGATPSKLLVPGEMEFTGRGVSYCATCDGALYRDKNVAVIGGGDTAAEDAIYLSRFAKSVTVVHRRDRFRAQDTLVRRMEGTDNISFAYDTITKAITGETGVSGLSLENVKTGEQSALLVDGVFVAIGIKPNTALVKDMLALDPNGYIIASEDTRTEIPGVYAAGDIRTKPLRQIVCAASDGAVAATMAQADLMR